MIRCIFCDGDTHKALMAVFSVTQHILSMFMMLFAKCILHVVWAFKTQAPDPYLPANLALSVRQAPPPPLGLRPGHEERE